jgi:hypothetical protein
MTRKRRQPPVRQAIRQKYAREFRACARLAALDQKVVARVKKTPLSSAATFLRTKARKTFDATVKLASDGYGEDAVILSRSLTNLCIDLTFLSKGGTDAVRAWIGRSYVRLRTWARDTGSPLRDGIDWPLQEQRAKGWPETVRERSTKAGTVWFYNLSYRHGSIFEHSDPASVTSFVRESADGLRFSSTPSDELVRDALLMAAFAEAEIITQWSRCVGLELGRHADVLNEIIDTGFPGERMEAKENEEPLGET